MTLTCNSAHECEKWQACSDKVIIMQPSAVDFYCVYETSVSTTVYQWYFNDVIQPALTTSHVSINIPSGTHTVRCRGMIDLDDNCVCDESQNKTVVVVGTYYSVALTCDFHYSSLVQCWSLLVFCTF